MEIETLKTIYDGIFLELLNMLGIVVLFVSLLAIGGFTIYLVGIIRFCREETRQPTLQLQKSLPQQMPKPPMPAENFHREKKKLSVESIHVHNISG